MDDAPLVRRLERLGDLPRDLERLVDRQRSPRQPLRQRLAVDELQDQRLDAARLLEAVDRGDVRMIQRGQDLRLALEARQPLGVRGERLGQHLDRHVAIELARRAPGRPRPSRPRRAATTIS